MRHSLKSWGTARWLLVALGGLFMLPACSSNNNGNSEARLTTASHRPATSDRYPDFSRPLDSAMEQMSDEKAAQMEAQLTTLARQRRSGAMSEAEYWRRVRELQALSRAAAPQ